MKQYVFLTYTSSKKKSMNRKQQQTDSNCSLFITDFLLCSEHIRHISWSAHMTHSHSHSNHTWTKLSVLHLKLYTSSSLTWFSFSACTEKDLSSFSSSQLISKKPQSTTLAQTWWDDKNLTAVMEQTWQWWQEKKSRSKISYEYTKESRVSY